MYIKVTKTFQASLDDGMTVNTFMPQQDPVEVPDVVGEMAIKHYEAKEVKGYKPKQKPKEE